MFRKYQHIERINNNIPNMYLHGSIYIFHKIDGTNGSVWLENKSLKAGSRNRELSLESDNANFLANIKDNQNLLNLLLDYPNWRIFGEWLVPHTLKNYNINAWNKFYIFDIIDESDVPKDVSAKNYRKYIKYIPYDEYSKILGKYHLNYIPCISKLENPNINSIYNCLNQNGYLTTDGIGEGIVIKNYDYINNYDIDSRSKHWFKIIRKEFLEQKEYKHKEKSNICNTPIEEKILNDYCTESFIEKEYAKILNDNPNIEHKKLIPMLLNKIFHELICEESWNIIKNYKYPTINYKLLNKLVIAKIKEIKKELF